MAMVKLRMQTVSIWVVRLRRRLFAFTLGMTWKKLSFSAMFQGVGGAKALYVGKYMLLSDVEGNFNRSSEILNAWSPTNKGSDIPRLSKLMIIKTSPVHLTISWKTHPICGSKT